MTRTTPEDRKRLLAHFGLPRGAVNVSRSVEKGIELILVETERGTPVPSDRRVHEWAGVPVVYRIRRIAKPLAA